MAAGYEPQGARLAQATLSASQGLDALFERAASNGIKNPRPMGEGKVRAPEAKATGTGGISKAVLEVALLAQL